MPRQSRRHASRIKGFCRALLGTLVTVLFETQQRRHLRNKDRAFAALEALRRTVARGAALDGNDIRRHACCRVPELGFRDDGAAKR
jgi:hypothetical protein